MISEQTQSILSHTRSQFVGRQQTGFCILSSTERLTIRSMSGSQISTIQQFNQHIYDRANSYDGLITVDDAREARQLIHTSYPWHRLIIQLGETTIGHLWVHPSRGLDIFILPQYRKQGYATEALTAFLYDVIPMIHSKWGDYEGDDHPEFSRYFEVSKYLSSEMDTLCARLGFDDMGDTFRMDLHSNHIYYHTRQYGATSYLPTFNVLNEGVEISQSKPYVHKPAR